MPPPRPAASPPVAALQTAPRLPPLEARAIEAALPDGCELQVEVVASTGSTNADLVDRARLAAPQRPVLRAAWEQRAGRGRDGRRWHAAPGSALMFSIAVPLRTRTLHPATTLACGVAIARELRAVGVTVEVKWPNDLLVDGAKLGGVLSEVAIDPQRAATIVVGVGLNLWMDEAVTAAIGAPVATLAQSIDPGRLAAEREAWLARLAAAVVDAVRAVGAAGFAPWRSSFDALFAYRGRAIELRDRGAAIARGVALGVDDDGQLLVETPVGTSAYLCGDLSLRLAGA